jgi:hypothetical protein
MVCCRWVSIKSLSLIMTVRFLLNLSYIMGVKKLVVSVYMCWKELCTFTTECGNLWWYLGIVKNVVAYQYFYYACLVKVYKCRVNP